jgi:hypothetical protein
MREARGAPENEGSRSVPPEGRDERRPGRVRDGEDRAVGALES